MKLAQVQPWKFCRIAGEVPTCCNKSMKLFRANKKIFGLLTAYLAVLQVILVTGGQAQQLRQSIGLEAELYKAMCAVEGTGGRTADHHQNCYLCAPACAAAQALQTFLSDLPKNQLRVALEPKIIGFLTLEITARPTLMDRVNRHPSRAPPIV